MRNSLVQPKRLVNELQREAAPRTVYKAFLAEEYDGIGQYVLITLALSSTSAAYKARVASGDFGNSQRMPIGTPVSVFSYRGTIEIISMGSK